MVRLDVSVCSGIGPFNRLFLKLKIARVTLQPAGHCAELAKSSSITRHPGQWGRYDACRLTSYRRNCRSRRDQASLRNLREWRSYNHFRSDVDDGAFAHLQSSNSAFLVNGFAASSGIRGATVSPTALQSLKFRAGQLCC